MPKIGMYNHGCTYREPVFIIMVIYMLKTGMYNRGEISLHIQHGIGTFSLLMIIWYFSYGLRSVHQPNSECVKEC